MILALGSAGTRAAARVLFAIGATTLIMESAVICEVVKDLDDEAIEHAYVVAQPSQVSHAQPICEWIESRISKGEHIIMYAARHSE